jgi:hypothetical protein
MTLWLPAFPVDFLCRTIWTSFGKTFSTKCQCSLKTNVGAIVGSQAIFSQMQLNWKRIINHTNRSYKQTFICRPKPVNWRTPITLTTSSFAFRLEMRLRWIRKFESCTKRLTKQFGTLDTIRLSLPANEPDFWSALVTTTPWPPDSRTRTNCPITLTLPVRKYRSSSTSKE